MLYVSLSYNIMASYSASLLDARKSNFIVKIVYSPQGEIIKMPTPLSIWHEEPST